MDYISNSVRKISTLLSSPEPSSRGKRRPSRTEAVEQAEALDLAQEVDSEHSSSDERYNFVLPQQLPQKRMRKYTVTDRAGSTMQDAHEAVRRAQVAMGKGVTDTHNVQEELERETRLEQEKKRAMLTLKTKLSVSKTTHTAPRDILASEPNRATQPNRHARDVLSRNEDSAKVLLEVLKEPAHACHDIEIRDEMRQLQTDLAAFAQKYFFGTDNSAARYALKSLEKETVLIVGCVASGGPSGAKGWKELFYVPEKRQAIVCAIVGNVLVEQVLQHLFFGSSAEQNQEISALQFEHRHEDGFDRTALYAVKIRDFLTPPTPPQGSKTPVRRHSTITLPPNFNTHVAHVVTALYTHLLPIRQISLWDHPDSELPLTNYLADLHALVVRAGMLSLHMRMDTQTAYHFDPVFKETPFQPSEMTSFLPAATKRAQTQTHTTRPRDRPLVQIAILPSLTAFRRGGWSYAPPTLPAKHTLPDPEGVRARLLTPAWVLTRHGVPRAWDNGKPADVPAAHGDAWRGGFVEFYPGVRGVRDPRGNGRVKEGSPREDVVESSSEYDSEAEMEVVREGVMRDC